MALTDGLIAYHKLDIDYTDSLAFYNATNTGSTISLGGKINKGSTQSSSYFRSPAPVGSAGTISVWFKQNTAGADGMVVGLTEIGQHDFLRIRPYTDTDIQWTVYDENINTPVSSLGTGYHHAVLTWDSSSNWKCYLDNVLVGTGSSGRNPTTSFTIPFGVLSNGAGIWSSPFYQDGISDEIGIWNRLISATEVSQLWNDSMGIQTPFIRSVGSLLMCGIGI